MSTASGQQDTYSTHRNAWEYVCAHVCVCVYTHTHLSYLNVRFVDGLRVRLDDRLHVEDVVFFNVLESLQRMERKVYGPVVQQIKDQERDSSP